MAFEYSISNIQGLKTKKRRYKDKMKIVECAKDLYCCLESKSNIACTAESSVNGLIGLFPLVYVSRHV